MAIFGFHRNASSPPAYVGTRSTLEKQASEEALAEREGQSLAQKGWAYWGIVLLDVILTLLPLCFIVLAVLSLSLHKRPQSDFGEMVQKSVLFSPTVFPIMYAAIFGKLLRRIGIYKAEKGAKVRTLERLIGSQSVYSAIERQVGLRTIDLLGFALIILWLLSPLGGQASLRILNKEPRIVSVNDTVSYLPIEGYTQSFLISPNVFIYAWPRIAPLYMTALQLSNTYMNSSLDLWGGVRIPDITTASRMSEDGWYHFLPNDTTTGYTSLFGLPTVGIPENSNTTFNVMTHYWAVNCGDFVEGTSDWNNSQNWAMYRDKAFWVSFTMDMEPNDVQKGIDFTYTTLKSNVVQGSLSSPQNATVARANCSLELKFTESRIECTGRDCRVPAMRNVVKSDVPFPQHFILNLGKLMPGSDVGMPQLRSAVGQSEMTEVWIANPSTTFDDLEKPRTGDLWNDVSALPGPVFSKRLQTAINTFWDSSLGSRYRTRDLDISGNFSMCANNCLDKPLYFNTTQATGSRFDGEQYSCNKAFAIITIAISFIVVCSAVASLALAAGFTKAPDIFGYVAPHLRDNEYADCHVPSHLDGLDSARVLGDVRVMIGDVKGEADVGHVAVATVGDKVKCLEKGRLYD